MTSIARDPNDVAAYDESAGRVRRRRASEPQVADRDRRLRPGLARAVRAGGGAHPRGARREGRAARARGLDVRADPPRQADHRHRARGPGLRRRAGVRARPRGRRLRSSHPGARVVRAPAVQGAGHERQSPRLLGGCEETDRMLLFRDWLRTNDGRPRALRGREARARGTRLEVRAAVRRREDGGRRRDHVPSRSGETGGEA